MGGQPRLSFWQIWNMSFGFLGIQFGFALQGGFMSRIFQTLGADQGSLPLLWVAAPLTGLLVQPVVGYLSDRTWHPRFGRRRPYFLIGAVLSSIALFFMPYSSALWMAAGFLWVLDASINISMEPFRALVADKLPDSQRSYGFVLQTLIIGIGTWVASNLPWFVNSVLGVSNDAAPGVVPDSVRIAFAIGAFVFLASVLFTVFTTSEYPPEDIERFKAESAQGNVLGDILHHVRHMPAQMLKLGFVQFFSWFAFFTMWSLATPALTEHVFKAPAPDPAAFDMAVPAQATAFQAANGAFQSAADLVGSYMGFYGLSSMLVALLLSFYAARFTLNCRLVHFISLTLGGIGFLSMFYVSEPKMLMLSFALIGVSWASILSMPYALLAGSVDPKKMGIMMGLFNMFIVLPQIVAALGGVNAAYRLIGPDAINAMTVAGIALIIGGLLVFFVKERSAGTAGQ